MTDSKVINLSEDIPTEDRKETVSEKNVVQPDPKDYEPVVELDGKSDEEIINLSIKRINEQSDTSDNGVPAIAIYLWLLDRVKSDVELAKRTLLKSKTLAKSFEYLTEVACNRAKAIHEINHKNKVGIGMSDNEILTLIEEYYMLNDYEIDKRKAEEKAKAEEAKKKAEAERKAKAAEQKAKAKTSTSKAKKSSSTKSNDKSKDKVDEEPFPFSMLG